ncbi:hypothetical protein WMY93_016571 [Mugilogobius chulae]|uniref:Uncharacterized protein n=1 Tax=Mugilogobius chulae TaxID=88201 RepID=A0AAW0NXY2_9GOBI
MEVSCMGILSVSNHRDVCPLAAAMSKCSLNARGRTVCIFSAATNSEGTHGVRLLCCNEQRGDARRASSLLQRTARGRTVCVLSVATNSEGRTACVFSATNDGEGDAQRASSLLQHTARGRTACVFSGCNEQRGDARRASSLLQRTAEGDARCAFFQLQRTARGRTACVFSAQRTARGRNGVKIVFSLRTRQRPGGKRTGVRLFLACIDSGRDARVPSSLLQNEPRGDARCAFLLSCETDHTARSTGRASHTAATKTARVTHVLRTSLLHELSTTAGAGTPQGVFICCSEDQHGDARCAFFQLDRHEQRGDARVCVLSACQRNSDGDATVCLLPLAAHETAMGGRHGHEWWVFSAAHDELATGNRLGHRTGRLVWRLPLRQTETADGARHGCAIPSQPCAQAKRRPSRTRTSDEGTHDGAAPRHTGTYRGASSLRGATNSEGRNGAASLLLQRTARGRTVCVFSAATATKPGRSEVYVFLCCNEQRGDARCAFFQLQQTARGCTVCDFSAAMISDLLAATNSEGRTMCVFSAATNSEGRTVCVLLSCTREQRGDANGVRLLCATNSEGARCVFSAATNSEGNAVALCTRATVASSLRNDRPVLQRTARGRTMCVFSAATNSEGTRGACASSAATNSEGTRVRLLCCNEQRGGRTACDFLCCNDQRPFSCNEQRGDAQCASSLLQRTARDARCAFFQLQRTARGRKCASSLLQRTARDAQCASLCCNEHARGRTLHEQRARGRTNVRLSCCNVTRGGGRTGDASVLCCTQNEQRRGRTGGVPSAAHERRGERTVCVSACANETGEGTQGVQSLCCQRTSPRGTHRYVRSSLVCMSSDPVSWQTNSEGGTTNVRASRRNATAEGYHSVRLSCTLHEPSFRWAVTNVCVFSAANKQARDAQVKRRQRVMCVFSAAHTNTGDARCAFFVCVQRETATGLHTRLRTRSLASSLLQYEHGGNARGRD